MPFDRSETFVSAAVYHFKVTCASASRFGVKAQSPFKMVQEIMKETFDSRSNQMHLSFPESLANFKGTSSVLIEDPNPTKSSNSLLLATIILIIYLLNMEQTFADVVEFYTFA